MIVVGLGAVVTLAACGAGPAADAPAAAGTVEVTDNTGTVRVPSPAQRVAATDNRAFRTLEQWGIPLVAAPVPLLTQESRYRNDPAVADLGTHREPDFEALVAANPDVLVNGQRFADKAAEIRGLVPDAAVVTFDPDEAKPLDEELVRHVRGLGATFGREADAQALADTLHASVTRAREAYDPSQTVMGLLTSGRTISYVAPGTGRSIGPVFDVLGLTPALAAPADDASHGDDISVEAIAAAQPDWLFVMDRDAPLASRGGDYVPAKDLIENSPALQNVPAVRNGQIVYLPSNFYLTEDIQAYTELFEAAADAFAKAPAGRPAS
ncbi:ABC transporter substrate-binding protein [Pseudonocardia sp. C8]|nr:ABC transporter substrate-binding protein [Pseudonocardia sp. C8]MBC3189639.1 ABC transporter substrate-binding protein [Pseudonocardia sp. C8]